MGFIYKISNDINDKVYIGETIRPEPLMRWNAHKAVIKVVAVSRRHAYPSDEIV